MLEKNNLSFTWEMDWSVKNTNWKDSHESHKEYLKKLANEIMSAK